MKASAISVLAIFESKSRLEVPLFQRQYVWTQSDQWEPLWEDISRKFRDCLGGRKDAPVHFLGAMVLDQKMTPTGHVEKRQVIDGQQRLTTLQLFIASFRDFCRAQGLEDIAKECDTYTVNKGMMADPATERFKVWPTQLDREQFADVILSGSPEVVENKHPLIRKKYSKKYLPRPRMVEAYLFFLGQLRDFFLGETEAAEFGELDLATRVDECFQTLKGALQVVVIDLERDDDAQVIFETLNARGAPLLPADLLRNYIFLRAARQGEPQERLYEEHWKRFDEPFWRQEVKQGRLLRPRSDLFMQHFLASRQAVDVPVTHLFVEYKFWIEHEKPFGTVEAELATIARQGDQFRRILEPKKGDVIEGLVTFLDAFDIRTAYPLLLALFEAGIPSEEWHRVSTTLESYLLRRAVCGLTTKSYNKIFLSATKRIRKEGASSTLLGDYLASQSGESGVWPSDDQFGEALRTKHLYQTLNNPKVVHILRRLDGTFADPRLERIIIDGPLTVEHILPQGWREHWPLLSGDKGMELGELWQAAPGDARADSTRKRDSLVHTLGNLTILTQPLNSSVSNDPWSKKKPELLRHSLLAINQVLVDATTWGEEAIEARASELSKRALAVWPRVAEWRL